MRYWFDTEFIERGPDYPIELLSIGMVAEDGREFYAESSWVDRSHASMWVQKNVLPYLHVCPGLEEPVATYCPIMGQTAMADALKKFCNPKKYGKPEFWAYYADYDWVVFCQLFGTMMDLPKGWPMYCRDIKQAADWVEEWIRGVNQLPDYKLKLPEQEKDEHHALADARWNKIAWQFVRSHAWLGGD